jgi:hypothetical protein
LIRRRWAAAGTNSPKIDGATTTICLPVILYDGAKINPAGGARHRALI